MFLLRKSMPAIAGFGVLVALFVYMLLHAFPIGPDPLIDWGREISVPIWITQGKILYKDIAYFNGPISPYLNALFSEFVPLTVRNLKIIDAVLLLMVAVFMAVLSFQITRKKLAAFLSVFVFFGVFAFQSYYQRVFFSFIRPYSHEMLHGPLFLFVMFVALHRYFTTSKRAYLALTGVMSGLLFLSKPEFALAFFLSVPPVICLRGMDAAAGWRKVGREFGWLFAFFLMPVAAFGVHFVRHLGLLEGLLSLAGSWRYIFGTHVSTSYYYQLNFGLTIALWNLGEIAKQLGSVLLFCLTFEAARRSGGRPRTGLRLLALASPFLSVVAICFLTRFFDFFTMGYQILIAAFFVILFVERQRKRKSSSALANDYAFLAFLACSFVLLFKIILAPRVYNYGFALALPATISVILFGLQRLSNNKIGTAAFALLWLLIAGFHIHWNHSEWKIYRHEINFRNQVFLTHEVFASYQRALEMVDRDVPEKASLLVLPEGLLINVLTGRSHPSAYTNFLPPEFSIFGHDAIRSDIERSRADYILLIDNRYRPEWVYQTDFCRGYGKEIVSWLKARYSEVDSVPGPETGGVSYRLFRRNEAGGVFSAPSSF